ncbi:MAG: hypothetical protein KDK05_20760, partial [Candidatus Competibacteraceae bacterium]|nr:hypothetical protein [Candidatus Competibacteraceae bacterium]
MRPPENVSVGSCAMSQSVQKSVRTTCPYCGVGCGINVTPHANGM